ncbi:outer membrane beta-barrel protein [Psychromonas sp. KJ10-10]|uniref:outer membrane beta-barrel protein n=1 Tax=Psychromonas sp. KJ10-10 TaxID=3391823 RepID=UPI0039B55CC6
MNGILFYCNFAPISLINYSRATLDNTNNSNSIIYENYGISSQYYFNSSADLRPFITAGLSEMIIDEDNDADDFQLNAGLGIYYKINQNWALQTDWTHHYSRSKKTQDILLSSAIIYRFGKGER